MIGIQVQWDFNEEAIRQHFQSRIESGVASVLAGLEAAARSAAPARSGALGESVKAYMDGIGGGRVVAHAHYASYVHEGTGIYGHYKKEIDIRPVSRKALFWPGAAHPVRGVRQKGIRPNPFITDAFARIDLQGAFDQGVEKGD